MVTEMTVFRGLAVEKMRSESWKVIGTAMIMLLLLVETPCLPQYLYYRNSEAVLLLCFVKLLAKVSRPRRQSARTRDITA